MNWTGALRPVRFTSRRGAFPVRRCRRAKRSRRGLRRISKVLGSRLTGVLSPRRGPADPAVLALSAVALALVALCAGFIPAHRASRVDPMRALKYE